MIQYSKSLREGLTIMNELLKLPVGVDSFEKIRTNGFYYVDKTGFIEQLFSNLGEVNLFTRPRRFGKTLNMSMLKSFLEIGCNKNLFDGLYICGNKEICEQHMGKYPVIFITLKSVDRLDFESAKYQLKELIGLEANRFSFLRTSDKLNVSDKDLYESLCEMNSGRYLMDDDVMLSSLQTLSSLLCKHFKKKAVILIDEYDVPLDKAFQNGYYREMVDLIRGLFGKSLKSNDNLAFAVLTGCLRISKESIFTGLNNFKSLSITDSRFDEEFGFTDDEVRDILTYYKVLDRFEETKQWYDGYRFGNTDVYCPWDVINHVDRISHDLSARPEAYWINTSGNALVKRFIDKADKSTREKIEQLIAGKAISMSIRLDLTYDEIDNSIDNLWSVLFTTGYLTYTGVNDDGSYNLIIPNKEVREVFKLQIQEWFKKTIFSNTEALNRFYRAIENKDTVEIEKYLNKVLSNSVSVFDTKKINKEKEASYHNLLVGILTGNGEWLVRSNIEAGDGFVDIIVETDDPDSGIVFELKYASDYDDMEKASALALKQINDKRYYEYLTNEQRTNVLLYGISFYKKRCKVIVSKL